MAAEPLVTTEILRWSIPTTAKQWFAERLEGKDWRAMAWKAADAAGPARKYFDLDELSVEVIAERWGAGTFRIHWCGLRGRLKFAGEPFAVHAPAGTAEAARLERQAPHNGASNGAAAPARQPDPAQLMGLPVATGAPPLVATDYPTFVRTRDASPMETFMSMHMLTMRMLAEQREHDDRRSREFMRMLDLRERQIDRDADVRIADAQARAATDREHAASLDAQLAEVREALLDARTAPDVPDELRARLDEFGERFDELAAANAGEDDDEPGIGGQIVMSLVADLVPLLKDVVRAKWAASTVAEGGAGAAAAGALPDG